VKLPRDVSGSDLIRVLRVLGYSVVRQRGSHVNLVTQVGGEHHIVVPMHDPIKPGTFNSILRAVARHHSIERDRLLALLFGGAG
jgi:predicted RNA binding protein YcfA (HicA-like mRNA interferase family)